MNSKDSLPKTEAESYYNDIDRMTSAEIIQTMNREDKQVADAVELVLDKISTLVDKSLVRLKQGGRLFYIGAGTSGRLGILDASECPPTFGVARGKVIGIIAGGDDAIRNAVEKAEDDSDQCWRDLKEYSVGKDDVVIGLAASGRTPYVIGGIEDARENGLLTGCITADKNSPLARSSEVAIAVDLGPEFISGSSRLKAGSAQKMILNMISTACMVGLGHIRGNRMVDMQLSNKKLVKRGARIIAEELELDLEKAEKLLVHYGSVRKVLINEQKN